MSNNLFNPTYNIPNITMEVELTYILKSVAHLFTLKSHHVSRENAINGIEAILVLYKSLNLRRGSPPSLPFVPLKSEEKTQSDAL